MDSIDQIMELMARLTITPHFQIDEEGFVQAYTDGSYFSNEQLMGIGIWFGQDHNL